MEKEKAEIASLVERYGRVQSLMKYVNSDTLKESYNKQPKGKAVGVDGITKEQYGENLEENIESLLVRMKKFSYKPYPVRRAYIPKGNGKMRGLGIPSFEDKVVQGVFKEILEAIYEPKFKEFSFGFRPNRSCHDAIQRVNKHIMADKVNYILDADIKGFFDNLDHDWMIKFLEHDIADKNFIRYIKRFLIGGVMEDGKRLDTEAGTVQGGLISPVLANVYLHYTLDTWFDYVKKHEFKGEIYMVRYTDDFVCLFQYENEAQRFYQLLVERLRKFGLEIAEDKSRNGLILHSDQGWQYQHAYYRNRLKEHGIIQSMSRKGNCYDNCIMETFFGRIKTELYYGFEKDYTSFEEFAIAIDEYIDYYNSKRIQAKTKWMPPVKYREASMMSA